MRSNLEGMVFLLCIGVQHALCSTQRSDSRSPPALPDEVTGAGLLRKRGWRWWISRRILSTLFMQSRGRRQGRLALEIVNKIPLVVLPGVFHPGLFVSTKLLLDVLEKIPLSDDSSVLDLGTGTGVCAILAAKRGARVKAVDINPLAVRCANMNVLLNSLEDRVRVLEGNLFAPVGDERFDLVIFNPPYYEGPPRDWAEHAWRGEKVLKKFAEGLGSHLAQSGRALISLSTEMNLAEINAGLIGHGFEIQERRRRRLVGETLFACECVR